MKFAFDKSGNLTPAEVIKIGWRDFKVGFVEKFPKTSVRHGLVGNFERFVHRFQAEVSTDFSIWLDGSFVSQKQQPRDIDAVFWIPAEIVGLKKSALDSQLFTKSTKVDLSLDLYYAVEHPERHKRHFLTHLDRLYWQDVYGHTRPDEKGVQHPKGFFDIKFDATWMNS